MNTLRWKLLQLASVRLRIIPFGLRTTNIDHVPQGVIKLKKKEFQNLKHGTMTVSKYVIHFTQLSCYAPNDVDTDEKK
jgi:hypothetical protein